jgi:hypothetical protein
MASIRAITIISRRIAKPFRFLTPINIFGWFPYIFAPTGKSKSLKTH